MVYQKFYEKKILHVVSLFVKKNDEVHIDMYIIVSYGTKISEIAHNVQSKVKYTLDKTVGLAVDTVNIYVQGVRVTNP